ncbi:MAG TPA: molybdopterin-dependent oxidoreductase, partial [Dehalococcoidia bacterium]|nr:molybdopterin-dependent oxidoreductase [Dehalococcoidia bacterium]
RALLDCTGGWYTVQDWSGIRMQTLLQRAGIRDGARSIVVRSHTGYERRFDLDDAGTLLLATHVTGDVLSRGHGYPMRLVAPGSRGFDWVKWVTDVEVSDAHPLWEPPLPLQ